MSLVVLIGASGSGKTTIARAIEAREARAVRVFGFDSIGVPPEAEMIRDFGSREAWQRARTIEWMARLASEAATGGPILFEGQTRFAFLAKGAVAAGGVAYQPILIDCDDRTRMQRLAGERRQPELAHPDMMNWARYLRREARKLGHPILDTSTLSLEQSVEFVLECLIDPSRPHANSPKEGRVS